MPMMSRVVQDIIPARRWRYIPKPPLLMRRSADAVTARARSNAVLGGHRRPCTVDQLAVWCEAKAVESQAGDEGLLVLASGSADTAWRPSSSSLSTSSRSITGCSPGNLSPPRCRLRQFQAQNRAALLALAAEDSGRAGRPCQQLHDPPGGGPPGRTPPAARRFSASSSFFAQGGRPSGSQLGCVAQGERSPLPLEMLLGSSGARQRGPAVPRYGRPPLPDQVGAAARTGLIVEALSSIMPARMGRSGACRRALQQGVFLGHGPGIAAAGAVRYPGYSWQSAASRNRRRPSGRALDQAQMPGVKDHRGEGPRHAGRPARGPPRLSGRCARGAWCPGAPTVRRHGSGPGPARREAAASSTANGSPRGG